MNTWAVLNDFLKINWLIKKHFYRSLKNKHQLKRSFTCCKYLEHL